LDLKRGEVMKKALFVLFVLGIFLTACSNEVSLGSRKNYYGSVTVNNTTELLYVFVYPGNTLPTTSAEYDSMAAYTNTIASGYGVSPVKLRWYDETKSGHYLTTVSSGTGTTRKMAIGNFDSMGNATVDWDTMTAVPSS
jgi:hypothetical protein